MFFNSNFNFNRERDKIIYIQSELNNSVFGMGKKGKKSMKTAPSLQELQSTVNGMSISQALAAVKVGFSLSVVKVYHA